jgi:hypothetical protein
VAGILRASVANAADGSQLRKQPVLAAITFPGWFVIATFLLAALTWKILYLPLLLPAAVATCQRPPWRWHDRWQVALAGYLIALAGYGWLVGPAVCAAYDGGEWPVVALLVVPPVIALGITGPLPGGFAGVFAVVAQLAIVGLTALVVEAAAGTSILPLVAMQVDTTTDPEFLRGHVISNDHRPIPNACGPGGGWWGQA